MHNYMNMYNLSIVELIVQNIAAIISMSQHPKLYLSMAAKIVC